MNTKKHTLSLVLSTLLLAGATSNNALADYDRKGYDSQGYNQKGFDKNGYNKSGNDSQGRPKKAYTPHDSNDSSSDSHRRGYGDSKNDKSKQKVVVCHVPKGNPGNRHTIHISISAWPAHRDNHGGDTLGSCGAEVKKTTSIVVPDPQDASKPKKISVTTNNLPSIAPEPVHTITGCKGEARATLVGKLQSYYNPIIVSDDALKDDKSTEGKAVIAALSQCLNNGDSSDSGRGGHSDSHDQKSKVKAKEDSNKKKDDSQKSKEVHKRDSGHH